MGRPRVHGLNRAMESYQGVAVFAASFALITLSSRQVGQFFAWIRLPMISGYMFTGILAGPFVLGLLSMEASSATRAVDQFALGFIAYSAGGGLYLKELMARMKSIQFVTVGLVLSTFTLGTLAVYLLASYIPFMQAMPPLHRLAISLLAGAILVARSPSSAIAVIHELRAKGPFTQTALGVTVIMDAVVIVVFSINSSIAESLFSNIGFSFAVVGVLATEVALSIALGFAFQQVLLLLLSRRFQSSFKAAGILLSGYCVFALTDALAFYSSQFMPVEIHLEPLLTCMIAGFLITNHGAYRDEFLHILHKIGPMVYAVFFTLTGAALQLDILAQIWTVTLVIFAVRLGAIFLGSFTSGALAGDPMQHNRLNWMAYVTQAGVGLGLAKEVAVEFPEWGSEFATLIISVIVLNQVIGPILFKWAINRVHEAHPRARKSDLDAVHSAIIFGSDGQALALARQLRLHGWEVKMAHKHSGPTKVVEGTDIHVYPVDDYTLQSLREIGAGEVGAIVTMLSDEDNLDICETAFEHFGRANLVVQLNDRANFIRFSELGASIVAPSTAIISLLDHFVRSPSAVSLLLGLEEDQDTIDLEVRNAALSRVPLRELRLPRDILILSLHREGKMISVNGYTQFRIGDLLTVVGSQESLAVLSLQLGR